MDESTNQLIRDNLRLTKENNRLLRKMKRAATYGLILRILWIAVLIGIPVALYVYVIQPYYAGFQAGFDQFQQQIESVPGLNLLLDQLNSQNIGN